MAVNKKFNDLNLYKYLDYSAHGTTYVDNGTIIFECNLYNDESKNLYDEIPNINITFGENFEKLYKALEQITAEKSALPELVSFQVMVDELLALDSQNWNNIDDLEWVDTNNICRKSSPLYITNKHVNTKKIIISLQLDKNFAKFHPELLPLFYIISRITLYSVNTRISYSYGFYEAENITFNNKSRAFESVLSAFIPNNLTSNDLQELVDYMLSYISEIYSELTISRLIKYLSGFSYLSQMSSAPNYEQILDTTNILIGSCGWRKITTTDNLKKVLANITIETKAGNATVSKPIVL
jgi:hypothetical protein